MYKLNVRLCADKIAPVIAQALLIIMLCAAKAYAADIDITGGLQVVDSHKMAGKIMAIAIGIAALAGSATVIMLMYNAGKLGGKERTREEGKEGIQWSLIGLVVVGLGAVIVGFMAFLIQQAQNA